jgi:hypothetical protein
LIGGDVDARGPWRVCNPTMLALTTVSLPALRLLAGAVPREAPQLGYKP